MVVFVVVLFVVVVFVVIVFILVLSVVDILVIVVFDHVPIIAPIQDFSNMLFDQKTQMLIV